MRKLHELEALLESSDTLSPITLGMQKKHNLPQHNNRLGQQTRRKGCYFRQYPGVTFTYR
jgi:hypothetical protein